MATVRGNSYTAVVIISMLQQVLDGRLSESKFRDWLGGYEWGEPRGEDRVARAAIAQLALVFGLADVGVTDRQHVLHMAEEIKLLLQHENIDKLA